MEKQRITTKYSFPSQRPSSIKKSSIQARKLQQKQQQQQQQQESQNDPSSQSQPQPQSQSAAPTAATSATTATSTPIALLTLKTYNPTAGICLKYRTTKAAEVGRLITSLGKLAAGADVASLGLSAAGAASAPAGGGGGGGTADVEMTDAPAGNEEAAPAAGGAGKTDPGVKGGKSKKKGKGKR